MLEDMQRRKTRETVLEIEKWNDSHDTFVFGPGYSWGKQKPWNLPLKSVITMIDISHQ
jgi:hypothetical protein